MIPIIYQADSNLDICFSHAFYFFERERVIGKYVIRLNNCGAKQKVEDNSLIGQL